MNPDLVRIYYIKSSNKIKVLGGDQNYISEKMNEMK